MSGTSIIRVTARGFIDRTFGKSGVANIPLESTDTMSVLSDGRIAVAGTIGTTPYQDDSDPEISTTHDGIAMLTANGQLDSTFGHKGINPTDDYVFVYGSVDSEEEQIEDRQLIPMSNGRFLYLRSDHNSGNTYQNFEGEGFMFDQTSVVADVYRRDGSIDPTFQFDRTNVLSGSGHERPGTLIAGATAVGHDATLLFLETDDAGYEAFDQNDHLFMLTLAADGTVTRKSIREHFGTNVALRQADGAVLVYDYSAGGLVRYRSGGTKDNSFVADTSLISHHAAPVAVTNTDDGQVLALYRRTVDLGFPSYGTASTSFLAKLQSSDAPAGVFGGSNIHSGRTGYRFTITWSDDGNVDASSLGSSDVLVVAPDGSELRARILSIDPTIDSGVIEATYRAIGPGGSWDAADNGTYFIRVRSNHVFDTEGHAARGRVVGRFNVSIPRP
jgi:hypothetical protein